MSRCVGDPSFSWAQAEFSFSYIQLTVQSWQTQSWHLQPFAPAVLGRVSPHTGTQEAAAPTPLNKSRAGGPVCAVSCGRNYVTPWELLLRDVKFTPLRGSTASTHKHQGPVCHFPHQVEEVRHGEPFHPKFQVSILMLQWWVFVMAFPEAQTICNARAPRERGETAHPRTQRAPQALNSHSQCESTWHTDASTRQAGLPHQQLNIWILRTSLSSLYLAREVSSPFIQLPLPHGQGHSLVLLPQQSGTSTPSNGVKETTFECKYAHFPYVKMLLVFARTRARKWWSLQEHCAKLKEQTRNFKGNLWRFPPSNHTLWESYLLSENIWTGLDFQPLTRAFLFLSRLQKFKAFFLVICSTLSILIPKNEGPKLCTTGITWI